MFENFYTIKQHASSTKQIQNYLNIVFPISLFQLINIYFKKELKVKLKCLAK